MARRICAAVVVLAFSSAGPPEWARAEAGTAPQKESSEVLATVDGEPITEAGAGETARGAIQQAKTALYEARRRAAEEAIGTTLLEREAKRRGIAPQELLEAEVYSKVGQVPPQEIKDYYVANQARIRKPFQVVAAEIERHLKDRRAASWRANLVNELKKASKIVFLIEPPRVNVSATGPSQGPATAPVTIVEFSDFQCPFCAQAVPVLKQVSDGYGDRVRIVYRDFPVAAIHPQAAKAAEAARCADEQGKFWAYHDKLFANQQALDLEGLRTHAAEVGLDGGAFAACLTSSKFKEAVEKDFREGQKAGVGGTPTFFVNGRQYLGVPSFDAIRSVIDEELQRAGARDVRLKAP